jgi:hypothetical protein
MAHHFLGKHHKAATAAGEAEPPKVTDWRKEEKHHKHMEQLAQLGTVIAGAKKGPSTRTPTRSRKASPPPSPLAAPASPSTNTTRRRTPRSTADTAIGYSPTLHR